MSTNWQKEMRAKVRAGDPEALARIPHGITGYGYGCRCDVCEAARTAASVRYRRRVGIAERRVFTDDEKFRALRLAQVEGNESAARSAGVNVGTICYWRRHANAQTREALGLLAEIDQIRNGVDGWHCAVDGVPMPPNRTNKGVTCSPRCAEIWVVCRYQLDPVHRENQQVRVALWNIEHTDDEIAVRYARRVVKGAELEYHGRWTNSDLVRSMLAEVMDRRASTRERWGDLAATLPDPIAFAST